MSHEASTAKSSELVESQRNRLVRARERYGMPRLVAVTGICENSLWKAMAPGARLYHSTWIAIGVGLDTLERTP